MSTRFDRIRDEATRLPPRERAALAVRLIESLDEEEWDEPAEVERAWDEEIRRRLAELDAGTVETNPGRGGVRRASWSAAVTLEAGARPPRQIHASPYV